MEWQLHIQRWCSFDPDSSISNSTAHVSWGMWPVAHAAQYWMSHFELWSLLDIMSCGMSVEVHPKQNYQQVSGSDASCSDGRFPRRGHTWVDIRLLYCLTGEHTLFWLGVFLCPKFMLPGVYRKAGELRIKWNSIQVLTRRENFLCGTEGKKYENHRNSCEEIFFYSQTVMHKIHLMHLCKMHLREAMPYMVIA
jgi:hypothetical protein